MNISKYLKRLVSQEYIWPPIDYELIEAKEKGYLKGVVLNAGAGLRDISYLIDGTLINQDIQWNEQDRRPNIHIFSPIHKIPKSDNYFDSILCIAVLEHVQNPEDVILEFYRVLKPGGYVIASVPFLQPEHQYPTDFKRYTQDGLSRLFSHNGFDIISTRPLFSVYHTLHWITYEWLNLRKTIVFVGLRVLLLPILAIMAKRSRLQSAKLASAFQVVAMKPRLT